MSPASAGLWRSNMKSKIIITAFVIAAFAALGLGRGAQADTGFTSNSNPLCTPLDNDTSHEIVLCTDKMTVEVEKGSGISVSVQPVSSDIALPNPPRVNFIGPATTIKVNDSNGKPVKAVFMELCFKDTTKANVFRWWTPADWMTWFNVNGTGRWVFTPTFHNLNGMSCTINWLPGTFTIN